MILYDKVCHNTLSIFYDYDKRYRPKISTHSIRPGKGLPMYRLFSYFIVYLLDLWHGDPYLCLYLYCLPLCLTYLVHYLYWRPFLWTLRFMPRRSPDRRVWSVGAIPAVLDSAPIAPEPQSFGTTLVYVFGHDSTRPFLCICILC